jgi:hypothetical protein
LIRSLLDASGVHGTLDLGVTGPTPNASNLNADLPSGTEGLPVNFDIQFIPLDGGPAIPDMQSEAIFQNRSPSQFDPTVPEIDAASLGSALTLLIGGVWILLRGWRRRQRLA